MAPINPIFRKEGSDFGCCVGSSITIIAYKVFFEVYEYYETWEFVRLSAMGRIK
jgi:hypothetical protein